MAIAVLSLLTTTAGCSGGESAPAGGAGRSASPSAGQFIVIPTDAKIAQVAGRLPRKDRPVLTRRLTKLVDQWWDGAYVGGQWPREDFAQAFTGFTPGARREAEGKLDLLTNATIGAHLTGVDQVVRRVRYDVLAPQGVASGATGRFHLKFVGVGEAEDEEVGVNVRGQLFFRKIDGRWKIFAYKVNKEQQ